MNSSSHDVIIIGAGVAGLTAALHLAERGLKPLVLEANPKYLGGRLAGGDEVEVNGWKFRLEHGVHGIWSGYRNFKEMLARHNILPELVPAKEELWIYRDHNDTRSAPVGNAIRNSVIPAPLHYIQLFLLPRFLWMTDIRDVLKLFHVWYVLIMAVGIDPFREEQPMQGMTLGHYVNTWSPALRAFFTGLARNGLSTHADEIPLAGFLAFLRFYTILRRDAWAFSYLPDDGGTSVIEPLAARVCALGGQILLGKRVDKIGGGEKREVHCSDETFSADQVILAVESAGAESILKKSFEVNDLYFPRSLANTIVRLWFDREPQPGPEGGIFTGDFVMHNFFWLERLYAPYRKWNEATGGSAFEVHIYGPQEILDQADGVLLARVISETYMMYPELRGHLIYQHLQRNAAVHTLPSLGPKERHLGIETKWENIFCAGDWVRDTIPSFFIERACATGIKAANAVLRKRGLPEWELMQYLSPEPFAAWIEWLMVKGRRKRRVV